MANPMRAAKRALDLRPGLLLLAVGLVLVAAPPSLAAGQPSVAADRVSFALRGPLRMGSGQRLVFHVRAPAGSRPTVMVHLTMPAMPMREPTLTAQPLGRGLYGVRAPLTMPGRWLAHVTIERGGASVTRVLPFRAVYGQPAPWRTLALGAGLFLLAVGLLAYRLRRRPSPQAQAERRA